MRVQTRVGHWTRRDWDCPTQSVQNFAPVTFVFIFVSTLQHFTDVSDRSSYHEDNKRQPFRAACNLSAACLWQQCCPAAQETRPASRPTPVDTTAYDRLNRHGSLPTVYYTFLQAASSPQVIGGARRECFASLGDLRYWGRQARTRGSHLRLLPGPVRGRPATLAFSLPQHRGGWGRAGRRAPAANQSRTIRIYNFYIQNFENLRVSTFSRKYILIF